MQRAAAHCLSTSASSIMSPKPLRIAIFVCGPVEGKLADMYTEGVEGTREIFHKFLTENPKIANPLDPNQKIFNPELTVIANGLQTVAFDVLGGDPVPKGAPVFDENDSRFPSLDALDTFDAIFVSGSGRADLSSIENVLTRRLQARVSDT